MSGIKERAAKRPKNRNMLSFICNKIALLYVSKKISRSTHVALVEEIRAAICIRSRSLQDIVNHLACIRGDNNYVCSKENYYWLKKQIVDNLDKFYEQAHDDEIRERMETLIKEVFKDCAEYYQSKEL